MIQARFQWGTNSPVDSYDTYGFIYVSSDNVFSAPYKAMESTAYPEEAGENPLGKTVYDAFDYKVSFLVKGETLGVVNQKIAAFNAAICNKDADSDVVSVNKLTFYNDYKRVKIVGWANPIVSATEFWRPKSSSANFTEYAMVELTIRVSDPSLCDFNTSA